MSGERVRARQVSQWTRWGPSNNYGQGKKQVVIAALATSKKCSAQLLSRGSYAIVRSNRPSKDRGCRPLIAWQGFRFIRTAHPRKSAACHKVPSKAASLAEFYEFAPFDILPPNTICLLDLKLGIGYEDIKCSIVRARSGDLPKYYGPCPTYAVSHIPGAVCPSRRSSNPSFRGLFGPHPFICCLLVILPLILPLILSIQHSSSAMNIQTRMQSIQWRDMRSLS